MILEKKEVVHFVEKVESFWRAEGPAELVFRVPNEFFTGQEKKATVKLACENGQWWYSVAQNPGTTGNPEKVSAEEVAGIIEKYLPEVNREISQEPWHF